MGKNRSISRISDIDMAISKKLDMGRGGSPTQFFSHKKLESESFFDANLTPKAYIRVRKTLSDIIPPRRSRFCQLRNVDVEQIKLGGLGRENPVQNPI